MINFDVFLIRKYGTKGLTKAETMDIFNSLNGEEAYPIEVYNPNGENSAMGFITREGAAKIDYSYHGIDDDGLYEFIAKVLIDMDEDDELANPLGFYEFQGLKILIRRSVKNEY